MRDGTRRALGTILVGILGGAFVGFALTLTAPFELVPRLVIALTGAIFGTLLALRAILWYPRARLQLAFDRRGTVIRGRQVNSREFDSEGLTRDR